MTEVRYSVPGVPPAAATGITAFSPHFNRAAASGAQDYKYAVRGYPGYRAIPMTAQTDFQMDRGPAARAQQGTARSSDAPDAIWPNQYYQSFIAEPAEGTLTGVQVYSPQQPGLTTLLPVPAEDGRGTYQVASARLARKAVLNRIAQLPWFPRLYAAPYANGAGNSG